MSLHGGRTRYWLWIMGATGFFGLGIFLAFFRQEPDRPDVPPTNSFDGHSEALQQTVVVPTLDTPIPENTSAIWCSSFVLAWNHLKTDVTKGPIQLKNAAAVADRLNQAEQTDSDLDARDFYAAAGIVKDGIIKRIQTEMAGKFPDLPTPELDAPSEGAVAYGYMRAKVNFKTPFFDNDDEFRFTEATGKMVRVKSFGIRKKDGNRSPCRDQFRRAGPGAVSDQGLFQVL